MILSFNGPRTSAVFVDFKYPAVFIAALILPLALPNKALRKSSCLGVKFFVMTLLIQVDIPTARAYSKMNALRSFLLVVKMKRFLTPTMSKLYKAFE